MTRFDHLQKKLPITKVNKNLNIHQVCLIINVQQPHIVKVAEKEITTYLFFALSVNAVSDSFLQKYLWDLDRVNLSHFYLNFALVDDEENEIWNFDDGFRRFTPSQLPVVLSAEKPSNPLSNNLYLEIYPYSYATIEETENQLKIPVDVNAVHAISDYVSTYDVVIDGLSLTLYFHHKI